eukprot:TRINITY_DN5417_c0_g1_i3.p1 TRINITY_DN5417_c0_g1~~TRINITY_DN5417_c0_g1_i3.p1  ORF type:complete len:214 (+),score=26.60 TRINITY_DN5417_c0_g1_i3:728-1369(+)
MSRGLPVNDDGLVTFSAARRDVAIVAGGGLELLDLALDMPRWGDTLSPFLFGRARQDNPSGFGRHRHSYECSAPRNITPLGTRSPLVLVRTNSPSFPLRTPLPSASSYKALYKAEMGPQPSCPLGFPPFRLFLVLGLEMVLGPGHSLEASLVASPFVTVVFLRGSATIFVLISWVHPPLAAVNRRALAYSAVVILISAPCLKGQVFPAQVRLI